HSNTGYLDLYADSDMEVYWGVQRLQAPGNEYNEVFSKMNPVKDGFLRLAFPPGHYQFRIRFLNLAILEPAIVEVDIQDQLITPVQVVLNQAGESTALSKETSFGTRASGRSGRRTRITNSQAAMYRLTASAQPSQPYKPKQQMPYSTKPGE